MGAELFFKGEAMGYIEDPSIGRYVHIWYAFFFLNLLSIVSSMPICHQCMCEKTFGKWNDEKKADVYTRVERVSRV